MPKISIIIPVYNVAKFLDKCVSSILCQTYSDFEVIMIDDGSDDGSFERCQELAEADGRITVFRQSHLRASAARNNGLRRAKGDYVMFLDSDDYIERDMLETLLTAADKDNLDVARTSLYIVENDKTREDSRRARISQEVMTGAAFFRHVVEIGAYSCSVVLGIYRLSLFEKGDLFFLEGHAFEDELWMPSVLIAARRVKYIHRFLYYHVMHEDSVMHSKDTDRMGRDLVAVSKALASVKNVPGECEKVWCDNLLGKYFSGFCTGRMYRREFTDMVSKGFPIPYVRGLKNAVRTAVYICNYRLFVKLNTRGAKFNQARGIVRS